MEDDGQMRGAARSRAMRLMKIPGGKVAATIPASSRWYRGAAMRTGWRIGKYNPKGYAIRTPAATMSTCVAPILKAVVVFVLAANSRGGRPGTCVSKVNQKARPYLPLASRANNGPARSGRAIVRFRRNPRRASLPPDSCGFRPARFDARFQEFARKRSGSESMPAAAAGYRIDPRAPSWRRSMRARNARPFAGS